MASDNPSDKERRRVLAAFAGGFLGSVALIEYFLGDQVRSELEPHTRGVIHRQLIELLGPTEEMKRLCAELFLGTRRIFRSHRLRTIRTCFPAWIPKPT